MKKQPTGKKSEKHDQEIYLKQQMHKDKERKSLISDIYKNTPLPKASRRPPKGVKK